MAVIALTSASGAPGVTTSALAMTLLWPRPVVLLEADASGGSAVLAGYLRGAVAPRGRSLLALAQGHRRGQLSQSLREQLIPLDDAGRCHLLPAVSAPAQAPSLASLWEPLAPALRELGAEGIDVIVDAGRLSTAHAPRALLREADLVLLVVRTQLPAIAAARAHAASFTAHPAHVHEEALLRDGGRPETSGLWELSGPAEPVVGQAQKERAGLLIVGDGRPYTGAEVAQATGLPSLASLAWDPLAAEVLSLGAPRSRRWEQGAFVRSAARAVDTIHQRLASLEPSPVSATAVAGPGTLLSVGGQRG